MNPSPNYRLLTLLDVEQAAQVISQAFQNDPLCSYILPWKWSRTRTLSKFFRAMGEVNIRNKRAYGVGDPLQGVAYWKLPEQENVSVSVKSLGNFLPLLFTYYPIGLFRARAVLSQIDAMHKKYAAEPHFYLDNLGVLPSAQGRGLSSKLMRPFMEMADSQKVIMYTDTVTPANVTLYEHFGFKCMEECHIQKTGITAWALRRPVQ